MKKALPGTRRRTAPAVAIASLVVVVGAVAAVVLNRLAADGPPFTLATPLVLRPVLETEYDDSCAEGYLPNPRGDQCYRLGEGMTVRQALDLREQEAETGEWMLVIRFTPADGAVFGELTGRLAAQSDPLDQLAVVVDGKIVTVPRVTDPITGGDVQLTGGWSSREEIAVHVDRLTP
ncbi:SecDF P1 head subdomain-containing protein [Planomonospora venezuelensis]|uniref:SecDF P1 head subdomain domain-containing protein n=1 Tax=Planomonospora venezuelensis TaxID=1999 RepID=A0A841D095_PLAVE|nr:hypothetical protein [Planomonospora venezuelensis]MBB5964082.1 hypothetical protein [Planomonospora venezuelensis]GIM99706.1 hypothetical protein Pve01_13650 [Planomonospora venezuelensis]